MDRPLEKKVIRARRVRYVTRSAIALIAVLVIAVAARSLVSPSVRRSTLRTARVDRGPVEATLTASGVVVPVVEHVITSPIDTRVLRVHKLPGAAVEAGEAIVDLDVGPAKLAVETLDDEIALKRNEQVRTRLELETTLADVAKKCSIKELELQSLQYAAAQSRALVERGILAENTARKAETDVERARIELQQLVQSSESAQRAHKVRDEGLVLEMTILTKKRLEAARVLYAATAVADRAGVLTWVVAAEGSSVQRGDMIARVADLSAFRVDATVSDVHAARVVPGMPAVVRIGEGKLPGVVHSVRPAVENGSLSFDIVLDSPSDARLRPNLRVDVQAVTATKPDALRLVRGTYDAPDGSQCAFIVRGNHAVRARIRLGLASFDAFEVVEGLREGDEVIVSDTSSFMHHSEVGLR